MTDVVIASSEADARAAQAMEQHHAQLAGSLAALVERLVTAAAEDSSQATEARTRLVAWCQRELVPHAVAEEQTLYPAARSTPEGRLLVDAMVGEHQVIVGLVGSLARGAGAGEPVRAAGDAVALRAVFESHLAKENDLIVPLLLRTPGASTAELLDRMHNALGQDAHSTHGAHDTREGGDPGAREDGLAAEAATDGCGSGHTCSCGEAEPAGFPELDARAIPHAIRHATIFGALTTVESGGGLVVAAPHDPLPLLDQISARWPGRFSVDYLERGPETWRLALLRAAV